MLVWKDLQGVSKTLNFLLHIFKAVSVKCLRLKCIFSISRTPVKNLLHRVLNSMSRNLEVSSHLVHNLKRRFYESLNKFTVEKYLLFRRYLCNVFTHSRLWKGKHVSALCTLRSLKGWKKEEGENRRFFKKKNKTKTPQQRKRFNYLSELHEILRIASWWLPDQGCRCYRQHASLNIHPARIGSPQRRADVPLRFPEAFYYTTPNSDVLHLGRNPPVIDRHFFFSLLFWNTSHDRFGFLHFPLCHSSETKSGRLQMHTPSTAFSIDTQIPRVQYRCNILRRL